MAKPYVPYIGPVVTREQAKASDLARFFTGKPCERGHLSQRNIRDGCCVVCSNENHRAWKADNNAKVLEDARDYYRRNRETILAKFVARYAADPTQHRARYLANTEVVKARTRARRLAKPDEVRAANQAWYAANKSVVMERVREWNAANPEAARSRGRNYRARFKGAEGSHTGDDIKDLFVKQQGRCVYCNAKLGGGYHVDHIIALANGGSNWPSNLQLTCAKCNIRKRATDPIEFARRLGRLV